MNPMKFALLTFCLQAPALHAQDTAPVPEATPDCQEAITVFQDVSRVGRKDRAASNMTKRHADMALEGWYFKDMEVYIENGDLEGFYLTYVRPAACPEPPADEG